MIESERFHQDGDIPRIALYAVLPVALGQAVTRQINGDYSAFGREMFDLASPAQAATAGTMHEQQRYRRHVGLRRNIFEKKLPGRYRYAIHETFFASLSGLKHMVPLCRSRKDNDILASIKIKVNELGFPAPADSAQNLLPICSNAVFRFRPSRFSSLRMTEC
jgi:hypothetical protein